MEVSTTFILSLFVCCTIAQTTYITSKGAAVSKILMPSSSVRSATVLPSTVTTKPKPTSTSTPTTVPSLAAKTTIVLPSTVTPKPKLSSTSTPTTVSLSAEKTTTVLPSTITTKPKPLSTSTPSTVPSLAAKTTSVLPSTVTTKPKPPSTSTPTTVPSLAAKTTTVLPSTVTPKPKLPSTSTPTTVPSSAAKRTTVLPSTAKSTTVLSSTAKQIIVPTTKTLFLEFKCAANGVITEISGVDKGEVVLLNGSKYCHLNEPNCDWKNKSKLNVLHVKGENSSNIAGGKNAHFYQLECKTAGAFVATANTSMQMAMKEKKPTEPSKTIRLVITDKKGTPAPTVHIGDPLLLKITGPAGYTIEPISCNASSSVDTDYVMWTNDSCSSKDTAVIENAWKYNKTIPDIVSISMYGFRFVKSNIVVITCSALFCPKGMQCSSKPCINGIPTVSSRRRRNAGVESKNGYLQESVSTSFTVVDNRIDTSGCSGTFGSVFTYLTACALLLTLK